MAGGKAGFLDELTGDFVLYLRADPVISGLVGSGQDARIYPGMARQGQSPPFITYTQAGGNSEKNATGLDGCENMTLHVYAYGDTFNQSRALARAVHDRMLPTNEEIVGDGTHLHVCNGGIIDDGVEPAKDGSDRKRFWTRLLLRMVIGD